VWDLMMAPPGSCAACAYGATTVIQCLLVPLHMYTDLVFGVPTTVPNIT